jgi:putative membrane protein
MGVGFAVSRFGLFLRQLQATEPHVQPHSTGLSVWSGIAIVVLGVMVNVSAVVRHFQLIRELKSGSWMPGRISLDAVVLASLLAVVGMGMAIYLTVVH